MICSHRWHAPRADAPGSVPVEHVCAEILPERLADVAVGVFILYDPHPGSHRCPCGASTPNQDDSLYDE